MEASVIGEVPKVRIRRYLAQCGRCLDFFSLEVEVSGERTWVRHPRVQQREGKLVHHCGGKVTVYLGMTVSAWR